MQFTNCIELCAVLRCAALITLKYISIWFGMPVCFFLFCFELVQSNLPWCDRAWNHTRPCTKNKWSILCCLCSIDSIHFIHFGGDTCILICWLWTRQMANFWGNFAFWKRWFVRNENCQLQLNWVNVKIAHFPYAKPHIRTLPLNVRMWEQIERVRHELVHFNRLYEFLNLNSVGGWGGWVAGDPRMICHSELQMHFLLILESTLLELMLHKKYCERLCTSKSLCNKHFDRDILLCLLLLHDIHLSSVYCFLFYNETH